MSFHGSTTLYTLDSLALSATLDLLPEPRNVFLETPRVLSQRAHRLADSLDVLRPPGTVRAADS
jgi:hypothetical protein